MTGNDHDLFRVFATFDIADHVCALNVWQSLRREHEFHFHRALLRKIDNQLCVFDRHGRRRNFRRVHGIFCLSGVRNSIIGTAN
jgi:hypothetical protein